MFFLGGNYIYTSDWLFLLSFVYLSRLYQCIIVMNDYANYNLNKVYRTTTALTTVTENGG